MQENPNISVESLPSSGDPRLKWSTPVTFYLSIITLVFVVLLSVWLYMMTFFARWEVEESVAHMQELDTKIASARQNKTIIVADILSKNLLRPSIDLKKLVNDFRMAARLSSVHFQWFAIQNDMISTTLIASQSIDTNIHHDPALTIIRMMKAYHDRAKNGSGSNLFTLEPIHAIEGDISHRRSTVEFKIIPDISSSNQ